MAPPDPTSNPQIRLQPEANGWEKLEWWHKVVMGAFAGVVLVFGAGMGAARVKAAVVMVADQKVIDDRQDTMIRAIVDDSGKMHVSMDDLHDEVRGMRLDLRYFDPRLHGGGLPALPEESPRVTPTLDPSMALPAPSARPSPRGTP